MLKHQAKCCQKYEELRVKVIQLVELSNLAYIIFRLVWANLCLIK